MNARYSSRPKPFVAAWLAFGMGAACACALAGCGRNESSPGETAPAPAPRIEAAGVDPVAQQAPIRALDAQWLANLQNAESETDALKQCLLHPSPPGMHWPDELLEQLCADFRTPVPQAGLLREHIDRSDWKGLRAHFDRVLAGHYADGPEFLLYRAFPIISWGSEEAADTYTRRWLAAQPDDPFANAMRAKFLLQRAWNLRGWEFSKDTPRERMSQVRGLAVEAIGLASRAIEVEPRLLPAYEFLIDAAGLLGDQEAAARALQSATRQSPHTYYVRDVALKYLHPKWGGSIEAMDALVAEAQRHVGRNPKLVLLRAQRADVEGNEVPDDQPAAALEAFRRSLAFGPYYTSATSAATMARDAGQHADAVVFWSVALRYTREPVMILHNRGAAWERIGKADLAMRDFAAASAINPMDAGLPLSMAYVEQKRGNLDEAERHYERALELQPEDVDTLERAVSFWVQDKKQPRAALAYAERLVAVAPRSPNAWLLLADVQHDLNDPRTRATAQRFLDLAPADDPQFKAPIEKVRRFLAE